MGKQNEYRFNLKFDETEEDHRRVSEFLNNCGRKKARYVVKAILAYWELQDGKIPAIDKSMKREAERREEVLTEATADCNAALYRRRKKHFVFATPSLLTEFLNR